MQQRGKKPVQGHVANRRLAAPPFPAFLIKNTAFNIAFATISGKYTVTREAAQEEVTHDMSLWPLDSTTTTYRVLKEKTSRTKEVTHSGSAVCVERPLLVFLLCCKADLVITTAKECLMCNYIFKSK